MDDQIQAPEPGDSQNEPPTGPSASPSVRQKKLERSCLMCHQRKIRCDKSNPCSNCVRVDVLCCYPSAQQRSEKRQHKTTITEVAARVARLERTVKALSKGASPKSPDPEPPQGSLLQDPEGNVQTEDSSPRSELLVHEGGTSRYFNELLLSNILAEEEELRSVIGTPRAEENLPTTVQSFNNGSILFGSHGSKNDLETLSPTRWQATQLWQTFISNVDPIVKVLHIPTDQVKMYDAISNLTNTSQDMIALLFSVYFAAVTSLSSNEVDHLLNQPKENALDQFRRGLEQALSRSNILDSPSMKSLQALTIYITCMRAHHCGRASWALTGLLLRLSKSVGLHRDGKNFSLSPFESEMRRRLWHQIDTMDARASEDLGISLSSIDLSSDTALPLHINDSELSVDMVSLPVPKTKFTDMTLALIHVEAAYIGPRVVQNIGPSSATMPDQESRIKVLKAHIDHVENDYLRYCNENIPVQRLTFITGRGYLAKLDFLSRHQNQSSDSLENTYTEDSLLEACEALEKHMAVFEDEMLKGFRWFIRTYFQYYVLTLILRYLCMNPSSPHYSRAMDTITKVIKLYDYDENHGPKWNFILQLKVKAERLRELNLGDETSNNVDESVWMQDFDAGSGLPNGFTGWNSMDQPDLLNWTSFADDFSMRGL